MMHAVQHVITIKNMKKNIFIILFFIFFTTNLYANCSSFYRSLGSPSKVSLLWLDDKNGKQAEWALINKVKGNTFSLCSKVRSNYSLKDTNIDSLKDFDFYKDFYNAEDAFKEVFKITSEETKRYILSKLYLPDYGISKSTLVTAFAFSQKEEQVSKYITKKTKPKETKKKEKSKSYITKKKKPKEEPKKIIKKEEPKKIVKKPTAVKQKEFKVAAKDLDETPPELTIKDKFIFDQPNYTIKGQVRDKGSKKLYVFVDNQMIDIKKNGRFQIKRFSPDSEKLEVKAVDQWGNEIVKLVDIEIKVKKTELVKKLDPLNPSKIRNANQGDVVALVIGIETYAEAPKAVYANRDAKFFAEYARYAFGASRDNIKLLIDKDATLPKMYGALEKWLPAKIKNDQTDVIVFFAGHGLASNDGKDLYLLTQDSDTDLLSRTALSRTELFKLINQHNPKSVKMFFDTCYSGQSREEKTLLASARPIRIGVKDSGGVPSNFTIFSASQLDQISSGLKEAKHGIFSYYLMKGLEGAADQNKDRQITNGELLAYMKKEVNSKAIELGRSQVPSLVGIKDNPLNRY
jgi:hypothetical protein